MKIQIEPYIQHISVNQINVPYTEAFSFMHILHEFPFSFSMPFLSPSARTPNNKLGWG